LSVISLKKNTKNINFGRITSCVFWMHVYISHTNITRLTVFENKALRRIFGPKRDEVRGKWRRLHDKKIYAMYFSPNLIRVIKS
jgi:hypothetical protein